MCTYIYIYVLYNCIYITSHHITSHYTTLHCITLHCITLHYVALHFITYCEHIYYNPQKDRKVSICFLSDSTFLSFRWWLHSRAPLPNAHSWESGRSWARLRLGSSKKNTDSLSKNVQTKFFGRWLSHWQVSKISLGSSHPFGCVWHLEDIGYTPFRASWTGNILQQTHGWMDGCFPKLSEKSIYTSPLVLKRRKFPI